MIWFLLILQLITLSSLVILYRRTRSTETSEMAEEEAQAEAFLAGTIERLLQELQTSADRASAGLTTQIGALETLLAEADEKLARLPATRRSKRASSGATLAATSTTPSHRADWAQDAITLANGGLSPREIARKLERGEREIRLAIAANTNGLTADIGSAL